MDRWIRLGLVVVWISLGVALFTWWRRRNSLCRYPYSERAAVILDALKQTADLGLIYWSKSEKKYLRRIVTPLELNGHSLKAFDHSIENVRIFRITRIRQVTIVPRGSSVLPSMLRASIGNWVLGACGLAAAGLLAVALLRGQGDRIESEAAALQPAVTNFTAPPPAVAEAVRSPATIPSATPSGGPPISTARAVELASTAEPTERWEVIVDAYPGYDDNQVMQIIQRTLNCSPTEAEEFVRQIRSLGHASVWQGQWSKAEDLRQALEGEDLLAHLEPAKSN